jgi:DNA-directed RNA polymerase subunit RPC12/RpoP
MSNFLFQCPHCINSLKVDVSAAGMEADCPLCGKKIVIPVQQTQAHEPATNNLLQDETTQSENSIKQTESSLYTLAQFKELLEETSLNIIPKLELAAAETRKLFE